MSTLLDSTATARGSIESYEQSLRQKLAKRFIFQRIAVTKMVSDKEVWARDVRYANSMQAVLHLLESIAICYD